MNIFNRHHTSNASSTPLWQKLALFARFVLQRFAAVNVPQVSASLTFTTLLALVPLLTVAVVVITAFPNFSSISERFNDFIDGVIIPTAGADIVSNYLNEFRSKAGNLTAIGVVVMVLTSLMLIYTIEKVFNRIWRVSRARSLFTRMLIYWSILTLGPVAIGFLASAWRMVAMKSLEGAGGPFAFLLPLSAITLALFLIYKVVPYRFVPARHALLGAFIAALLLEAAKSIFTLYIGNFNSYRTVYGAFAAIPVFLLWINLLWVIILSGAVLTAAFSYWQGEAFIKQQKSGKIDHVIAILALLSRAQQQRRCLSIKQLRYRISLGYDELGDLLEQLARAGYVAHTQGGWLLRTNANNIDMIELFQRFVYRADEKLDSPSLSFATLIRENLSEFNITLAAFMQKCAQPVLEEKAPESTPAQDS